MRMLSIFAAAAAISVAAPAAAETSSFEHEGYTYIYKVEQKGGSRVISGTRYPGAVRFRLSLRDGNVKGISNGVRVGFPALDAAGAANAAQPTTLSMR